ncbi:hypothetical protein C1645_823155 [Glomus cerebriforme]|uniref:F-box domain-containing protein n=1 Tax=Glomus cerebriforme TaxID=658196 RepID=A0A397T683_9GLOM|nr:hypothetical protein C1645_823155 [Glomus cerebriforme]
MVCQLPVDCLNEIFEYLEKNIVTLHSCLLVNRLWCKVSVRILWRDIWKSYIPSRILNTLIACLPNESKNLLRKNGIFISTPTLKYPLFNYASFCKVLPINEIYLTIDDFLKIENFNTPISLLRVRNHVMTQEIFKMLMSQITSLKEITYYLNVHDESISNNINFIYFPGTKECLTNLSELNCGSNINSEFFYQLSKICCNIQSLIIGFGYNISNGLKDLISSQNNLKYLSLIQYYCSADWLDIIPSFTKHSNTLIKLKINGRNKYGSLSFIAAFKNLQELDLLGCCTSQEFEVLQYVIFSKLQNLKFSRECPKIEMLIKFLEINGKNLKEFHVPNSLHLLDLLDINILCPNLKNNRY